MASSSDENLSDSDEDMISCHICLIRFNTSDRKPKFLDCHHYFCLNCIKGFANVINVACPTCRNLTKMSGRQLEDLATNNMALRFVTRITTERTRELAEQGKKEQMNCITQNKSSVAVQSSSDKFNKMWCSQCSVFSKAACREKKHKLIDSIQVLSEKMGEVEAKVSECCSLWDKAIEDRQRVHQYYDDILNSLRIVQNELMNQIEVNDSNIALMESRKQVTQDLCLPSIVENTEEDVMHAMSKTKYAIEQLHGWIKDGNRCQFVSRQLHQNLADIEENCIDVSFSNANSTNCSLRSVDLLKKLRLSFNGIKHPEPVVKACVSVLSFVILKVAEDQSKQTNLHVNDNQAKPNSNTNGQVNKPVNGQVNVYATEQRNAQVIGCGNHVQGNRIENNITTKPMAVGPVKQPLIQASNQSSSIGKIASLNNGAAARVPTRQLPEPTSFRDSLLKSPAVKTTNEWHVVAKSSGKEVKPGKEVKSVVYGGGRGNNGQNKCYFRMSINGILSEKIIVQLDQAKAPIMCAKFIEMCSIEKGYQGSKIYKLLKDEAVFCGSGWYHSHTLEGRRDIFNADKSDVAEQRGSLRFQVKRSENGYAQVSTEFLVILVHRPRHHISTSVFGRVIEGLEIFDNISRLCPKSNTIKFAECGVC